MFLNTPNRPTRRFVRHKSCKLRCFRVMRTQSLSTVLLASFIRVGGAASAANAQQPPPPATPISVAGVKTACGSEPPPPAALPPAGAPPFIWTLELCFDRQGNTSTVDNETYLYWIKLSQSLPSQGKFVPYDERAEQQMLTDFKALWGTKFLEDLSIEKSEHTFENGTVGVMVIYRME